MPRRLLPENLLSHRVGRGLKTCRLRQAVARLILADEIVAENLPHLFDYSEPGKAAYDAEMSVKPGPTIPFSRGRRTSVARCSTSSVCRKTRSD
jgi:hypothetical protein